MCYIVLYRPITTLNFQFSSIGCLSFRRTNCQFLLKLTSLCTGTVIPDVQEYKNMNNISSNPKPNHNYQKLKKVLLLFLIIAKHSISTSHSGRQTGARTIIFGIWLYPSLICSVTIFTSEMSLRKIIM